MFHYSSIQSGERQPSFFFENGQLTELQHYTRSLPAVIGSISFLVWSYKSMLKGNSPSSVPMGAPQAAPAGIFQPSSKKNKWITPRPELLARLPTLVAVVGRVVLDFIYLIVFTFPLIWSYLVTSSQTKWKFSYKEKKISKKIYSFFSYSIHLFSFSFRNINYQQTMKPKKKQGKTEKNIVYLGKFNRIKLPNHATGWL